MAAVLQHRGPDDSGVWLDTPSGVVLAHRRLSVQDVSIAGHQPMCSDSGRFVLVFNGEIYNHKSLRTQLTDGHQWRGQSDTETLLACIEAWGVTRALRLSVGMFALALWDRQTQELVLARDRMGEKPLYYGWQGTTFLFGSELKALKVHPSFRADIDRDALALLLRHGYIPCPHSIYRGISKLRPGTVLRISKKTNSVDVRTPDTYWALSGAIADREVARFGGSEAEAASELEDKLSEAVKLQLISDVPIGAFLSGGIDSSIVAALMQKHSIAPIKTFTIGFVEDEYDEARYAREVARLLGSDHTELYVTSNDAINVIPRLAALYDEPLGDASQIPTHLLSHLARRKVSVALSGDGADELFGGYSRYQKAVHHWRRIGSWPRALRRVLSSCTRAASRSPVGALLPKLLAATGTRTALPPKELLCTIADALISERDIDFYQLMVSQWRSASSVVKGAKDVASGPVPFTRDVALRSFEERMMFTDTLTYLPDAILAKVDRAAMAVSLETRVPFLDHRIVEFAWRLPIEMKIRQGHGKWLLKQVLRKYLGSAVVERPKMGFAVPVDHWLRGPLREWAEDLLAEERLRDEGFFEPGLIRTRWNEHISGLCNWRDSLWVVLAFQSWLAAEKSSRNHIPIGGAMHEANLRALS